MHCELCGTEKTPLWRKGPSGMKLCNACGLHWKVKGVLPDRKSSSSLSTSKKRKRLENVGDSLPISNKSSTTVAKQTKVNLPRAAQSSENQKRQTHRKTVQSNQTLSFSGACFDDIDSAFHESDYELSLSDICSDLEGGELNWEGPPVNSETYFLPPLRRKFNDLSTYPEYFFDDEDAFLSQLQREASADGQPAVPSTHMTNTDIPELSGPITLSELEGAVLCCNLRNRQTIFS
eukprot:GCRY01005628.1.p1 GENE.GCRY01005628.1~~GCRY01005628.1.p1  ORF type:complete len:234 (+),score=13.07 GCRY01005628.1:142-843(+)